MNSKIITTPELIAVVIIVGGGILGAVWLPDQAVLFLGFSGTIIGSLLALRASQKNAEKIQDLQISVDGRLTQLLETRKIADTATGKAEGKLEERDEVAARKVLSDDATK